MSAPDKFRFKDPSKHSDMWGDGGPIVAADYDSEEIVEYTRTELIPNAAYVAGLESAGKAALNFIQNTESECGVILGCGDSLRTALSARHDAPDTRVVTVDQLNEWVVAIQAGLFWRYADKIRAIIGEVK